MDNADGLIENTGDDGESGYDLLLALVDELNWPNLSRDCPSMAPPFNQLLRNFFKMCLRAPPRRKKRCYKSYTGNVAVYICIISVRANDLLRNSTLEYRQHLEGSLGS